MLLAPAEPVPLPGPLSGPLHFPSQPSCLWLLVWLLLVAALSVWLGRLIWRRLRGHLRSRRRPVAPAPPPAGPAPGIGELIGDILGRHLQAGSYRQGCHELSAALRRHWEERGLARHAGGRFTRMTAREIQGRIGDRPATRLLRELARLQFGRREPSGGDLQQACHSASELVRESSGE